MIYNETDHVNNEVICSISIIVINLLLRNFDNNSYI